MKNIIVLVKNNLKINLIKKPLNTIIYIIIPVLFLIMMTKLMVFSGGIRIGYIDESNSKASKFIIEAFKDNEDFNLKEYTRENIESAYVNREIMGAIIIDEAFEERILRGNVDSITVQGIEEESLSENLKLLVEPTLKDLTSLAYVTDGNLDLFNENIEKLNINKLELSKGSVYDYSNDYRNTQTAIGFIVLLLMYKALHGATLIRDEKDQKIFTRILVAPIKEWQYYLSNIIATFIMLEIQIGLTVLAIINLNVIELGINGIDLFIVLSLIGILALAIGIFCLNVTKSIDMSRILFNILSLVLLFLGGCFVPISYMSGAIDKISNFTPIRWGMNALINLQEGAKLNDVWGSLGIMILFAIAIFLASIYSIKYSDKSNEY